MEYKSLRGFRLDPGAFPFLVPRIVPRGFRLGLGNRVIFHHPELIPQLPRQFHRFTCRERLPHFILGVDREHHLAVDPFLADHGFPFCVLPLGLGPDRSYKEATIIPGDGDRVGTVAFAGGFLGNFLREAAVRTVDALGGLVGKLIGTVSCSTYRRQSSSVYFCESSPLRLYRNPLT